LKTGLIDWPLQTEPNIMSPGNGLMGIEVHDDMAQELGGVPSGGDHCHYGPYFNHLSGWSKAHFTSALRIHFC